MDNKPKCLNCGNPITKSGRKKFCSTECHREYDRKRKQFCPDCGIKLTAESTYVRGYSSDGQPWLDNYCKSCRIVRNREAYLKRRAANGVTLPQIKNKGCRSIASKDICLRDWHERGNKVAWERYMTNNPHYFTEAFNVPTTAANIAKIAAGIF